jgi:hypothetical protein
MRARRLPLGISIALLIGSSLGIVFAETTIEVFLCSELATISAFYIFFAVIIPALYRTGMDTEKIFLGGAAKSPYLSGPELFSPGIPLISEEIDDAWDLYYDKTELSSKEKKEK